MKILIDTHTHTVHSGHAYSTVNENLKYASENNIELVCLTDHAFTMPYAASDFYFYNLSAIPDELYGVKLLKGSELNILDESGSIDDFSRFQNIYESLEFRIASLHPPCISPTSCTDFTNTLINTMKNNNIDCLGHLGDPRYPFDIDEVIKYAKENNTLIELNNSSLNPRNPRFDIDFTLKIIESCLKNDVQMTFGSDAHFLTEVGNFENIHSLFKEHNISYDNVVTKDINEFLQFIQQNRKVN